MELIWRQIKKCAIKLNKQVFILFNADQKKCISTYNIIQIIKQI